MEELSNQVSRLEFQGKFDEAIRISKSKYNTLKTDKDRYQLALGIGAIYEMKSDYQQAITWYQKAKGLSSNTAKDRAVANGLARCYEKLGNKAQAHQYYQIMFDTVDKSKIGWQAEVNWYTAALKRTQS